MLAAVPSQIIQSLGDISFFDGQKDQAIALLENNIKSNPKSINSHYALASLYEKNKQPKKALEYFNKTLNLAKQQNSPFIGYIEVKLIE
jgi:Tfp pilus assembly protein PilF